MADNKLINVLVQDRSGIQYQGEVKAITSRNPVGIFDVLPRHINFITVVRDKLVLHQVNGSKMELNINNGVMRVSENKVEIYLEVR